MIDKNEVVGMKNQGLSYREIAKKLSTPLGTIKTIVSRASNTKKVISIRKENPCCKNCGKKLLLSQGKRKRCFCSDKCRTEYWLKNQKKRNCKCCGVLFVPKSKKSQCFCSWKCYIKFRKGGMGDE